MQYAGDVIGSVYEFASFKEYDFPLFSDQSIFTDDSVLTVAVADALYEQAGYCRQLSRIMHCATLAADMAARLRVDLVRKPGSL